MQRVASVAVVLLAACGSDPDPCEAIEQCIAIDSGASYDEIQTALIEVEPGGTVAFAAGTFELDRELSLDVDGVTIRGAGMDQTTLSFKSQASGAQGMLVTANDFTIRDIALEDSPGDALKILGARGVTISGVRVEWTNGPSAANGAYGLYPVQCERVLIENSVVKGASDAGIYVGQSKTIVVRANRAEYNVAGIEIENSFDADVVENEATNNTGGILVFNLPDLEVKNGRVTRLVRNKLWENNTENFAPPGNIVGKIPAGTGIALLAAHDVEIFENDIRDHLSVNIGIISYVPTDIPVTDATYDQYPTAIHIHDNTLAGVSDTPTGELGALLISAIGEIMPNGPYIVPDVAWDGLVDPARAADPTQKICIRRNGDADFINLAWPLFDANKPALSMDPHDCELPALPQVVL